MVEVPLLIEGSLDPGDIEIREVGEDTPPRLAAFRDRDVIGYVRSAHHDDLIRLLAIGVPLSIAWPRNDSIERTAWFGEAGP